MEASLVLSLIFYLSLTPSFFFGWGVQKVAYKRSQANVNLLRMLLLIPLGFFYLVFILNFLVGLTHIEYFSEIKPILGVLSSIIQKQNNFEILYKTIPEQTVNFSHLFIVSPILYFGFLIFIPFRLGKFFSKMYYSKDPLYVQFNQLWNEVHTIRSKFNDELDHLLKINDGKTLPTTKLEIIISKSFLFLIFCIVWLIIFTTTFNIILRLFFKVLLIERITKFVIDFMTNSNQLHEIESTSSWGFYFVTIDISVGNGKLISGMLNDYHANTDSTQSYFSLEKVFKREKSKSYEVVDVSVGKKHCFEKNSDYPVAIPGDCVVIPMEKIVSYNIFRCKKELILELNILQLNFEKNKKVYESFPLQEEDFNFVKSKINELVSKYYTGRICYTKIIFIYPVEHSYFIEGALANVIDGITFVKDPEYVEYKNKDDYQPFLKKSYSFLERHNYVKNISFHFLKENGEVKRRSF